MGSIPFDREKELTIKGIYKSEGTCYGSPYFPIERLTPPISPAENLRRFYRGEPYEWVPDFSSDAIEITPDCDPDVVACGFSGGLDAFGVRWVPDVSNPELPAFVEPGFLLIDDITDWKTLKIPDPDQWPWAEYAARYNEALKDDDRMRRGILLSGYFERLISIMTFQNAAMALVEDPDAVEDFFKALDEVNRKKIDHLMEDFHCEAIMIHDDWSAQRSPFFSPSIASELLAPHIKKLSDYVHGKGGFFTLHSCGNGLTLIPVIKETGADAWQAQNDAIDWDAAYEAAGDDFIIETYPIIPEDTTEAESKAFIEQTFRKYAGRHRGLIEFFDLNMGRLAETRRNIYEIGRKLAFETCASQSYGEHFQMGKQNAAKMHFPEAEP